METIVSKSHDEWLKSREGGIGSSEVGTILGLNPWETPYQLWLRKTGRVQTVEQENFLMKAGHYLEDAISRFYADEAGVEIVKSSAKEFVVIDREKPFMRVSPDRYAYPIGAKKSNENRMIVECKSTQKGVSYDDIPKSWFCQLTYQMGVCRINQGALAWLISGREFGYRNFHLAPDFFDYLAQEVERFWVDCVIGGQEPPLINVADVLTKFPRHTVGKSVEADTEVYEKWLELCQTNAEYKRLASVKSELEDAIKMALGDSESLVSPTDGHTLVTWKSGKDKSSFDAKRFEAENPELYAKYLVTKPGSRTFLCKI